MPVTLCNAINSTAQLFDMNWTRLWYVAVLVACVKIEIASGGGLRRKDIRAKRQDPEEVVDDESSKEDAFRLQQLDGVSLDEAEIVAETAPEELEAKIGEIRGSQFTRPFLSGLGLGNSVRLPGPNNPPPSYPGSNYPPPSYPGSNYPPPSYPGSNYPPPSYPGSNYPPSSFPGFNFPPPNQSPPKPGFGWPQKPGACCGSKPKPPPNNGWGWQPPTNGWQPPNNGWQPPRPTPPPNNGWQPPNNGWQPPNNGWKPQPPTPPLNNGWQSPIAIWEPPNNGWQPPNNGWKPQPPTPPPNNGWQPLPRPPPYQPPPYQPPPPPNNGWQQPPRPPPYQPPRPSPPPNYGASLYPPAPASYYPPPRSQGFGSSSYPPQQQQSFYPPSPPQQSYYRPPSSYATPNIYPSPWNPISKTSWPYQSNTRSTSTSSLYPGAPSTFSTMLSSNFGNYGNNDNFDNYGNTRTGNRFPNLSNGYKPTPIGWNNNNSPTSYNNFGQSYGQGQSQPSFDLSWLQQMLLNQQRLKKSLKKKKLDTLKSPESVKQKEDKNKAR